MSIFPELTTAEVEAEKARIAAREAQADAASKQTPIVISLADKRAGRAQGLAAEALRTGRPLRVERDETAIESAIRKTRDSGAATVTRAQLDANPGLYREKIMRGELKVAG